MRTLLPLLLAFVAGVALAQTPGRAAAQDAAVQDTAAQQAQAEGRFIHALGLAYLGDHAQAAERLAAILATRPTDPAVHDALAEAYGALGRAAEARYHAEESVRHGGAEPAFRLRLAALQREAGQARQAIATLEAALAAAPDMPEVLVALAELYQQADDAAGAERVLTRLAQVAETPATRLRLAGLAQGRAAHAEAAGHLERAHVLAPDEPAILEALADALVAAGHADEARRRLEAYLVRRPGEAGA
ncbi:MAG: tetratricopeptide repeat protein, partial [Rubricoccaceae bacterium]